VVATSSERTPGFGEGIPGDASSAWRRLGLRARDYLLLTKPIIVALLLVTTLSGMIVGFGRWPGSALVFWTLMAGAMTAGGASAVNQYIDRRRDGEMQRTRSRPLPGGRLQPWEALAFGTGLSLAGLGLFFLAVNPLSALLALVGWLYYVVLYSLILKHTTWHNIIVGGGAGAVPPLVGWAAATGGLEMGAVFLFALVFFWTPPHFWALAMIRRRDYARAGVPMLPVVQGEGETRTQILLYTIQLVALTLLLPLAGVGGGLYLTAAAGLGIGMAVYAWRLWREGGNRRAYGMYRYTSMYLALIFFALVLDTLVAGAI
jgi:protoheme IX farnesyltransferase